MSWRHRPCFGRQQKRYLAGSSAVTPEPAAPIGGSLAPRSTEESPTGPRWRRSSPSANRFERRPRRPRPCCHASAGRTPERAVGTERGVGLRLVHPQLSGCHEARLERALLFIGLCPLGRLPPPSVQRLPDCAS